MPYTTITATASGADAIKYALNGNAHDGSGTERNLAVASVGMRDTNPPSYISQMDEFWQKASEKNHNQVRRIIVSFAKEELDPDNPEDIETAREISQEFVRTYYPDRQAVICLQADGKVGHCLHAHILVNNVSFTDYKGCTDEQTKFRYVAENMDEIAKRYIELKMDYKDKFDENGKPKLAQDRFGRNVRRMRDENNEAVASGSQPPHYIWEDDAKYRIKKAMSDATSRDDFAEKLKERGIKINRSGSSKKYGEYFTYELTDTSNFRGDIPKNLKLRSHKLGDDYMPATLDKMIDEKAVSQAQIQPQTLPVMSAEDEEYNDGLLDWCGAHSIDYSEGGFNLEMYENAKKAYDEFLKNPTYEAPQEASDVPKRARRNATKAVPKPVEEIPEDLDDEVTVEDYKTDIMHDLMVQKVMNDAESMDANVDDSEVDFDVK